MTEKRLSFSDEMFRAWYEGNKTQTRRVMVPQPKMDWRFTGERFQEHKGYPIGHVNVPCPYGERGDTLLITGTWRVDAHFDNVRPLDLPLTVDVQFRALPELVQLYNPGKWRPARFLPNALAHDHMCINQGVRVEQLHEISYNDAIFEGVDRAKCPRYQTESQLIRMIEGGGTETTVDYIGGFKKLWDSINAERGYPWESNPWVWVIECPRMDGK